MDVGAVETVAAKPKKKSVDPDLVRRALEESGMSQAEAGHGTGVAEKTVWRWATAGYGGMKPAILPRFLEVLELPKESRARYLKEAGLAAPT